MKRLNLIQIIGIILTIIFSVSAIFVENDNIDTILGAMTAIGVSMIILGKMKINTNKK
ncbi:hypothetical protein SAMN05444411_1334 [Lutibacter oricola]|uniref:Uncharacterized protein n=1 Tax=Lutibacter oricola TaxID=762486 RepID=A0A1H3HE06_9FLAO|nr:hypothetical protein [Lutibacter oricola]SDY13088.1 hypothetical protein SAMN05444411_1334 [Lutibacter oricola]|tara:strand:- start:532 stop:705 length:174 start_codon:yes stop_codon:yes gene_type:complete